MYLTTEAFGHSTFDYPRGSLTGLVDRRAEERRTTRPVRAGDETGVPSRYRLVELETTAGALQDSLLKGAASARPYSAPVAGQGRSQAADCWLWVPRRLVLGHCSRYYSDLLRDRRAAGLRCGAEIGRGTRIGGGRTVDQGIATPCPHCVVHSGGDGSGGAGSPPSEGRREGHRG